MSTTATAATYEQCGNSGINTTSSVCVTPDYSGYRLTQTSEDGVLVIELDRNAVDSGVQESDGSTVISLDGRLSRLVYCSTESMRPSDSNAASCAEVLSETGYRQDAFTGIGKAYGDLRIDPWGTIACPSAVSISGNLNASSGVSFAVHSSAVFADDGSNSCEKIYRDIDLQFMPSEPTAQPYDKDAEEIRGLLERFAGIDQSQWDAVEALSEFNDNEFDMLNWFITADEQQLNRGVAVLKSTDDAYILADGSVVDRQGVDARGIDLDKTTVINSAAAATVVDKILTIVKQIRTTGDTIKSRLPNKAAYRDLIDDIPFAQLREVIDSVKDIIDPAMAIVAELRAGFDDFKGDNCTGVSQCATFQADIDTLFGNVEFLWLSSQQLICYENPNFAVRNIEMDQLETLVKKMPLILKYGIYQALNQVEFDWTLDNIAAQLPPELGGLCNDNEKIQASANKLGISFSNTGGASFAMQQMKFAATPQSREIAKCSFVRKLGFLGGGNFGVLDYGTRSIDTTLQLMGLLEDSSDIVIKSQKDDIQVTIAGVAVGGGGGGTNVKNYLKVILEVAKLIIGRIEFRFDRLQASQQSCYESDDTIERDLLACDAKLSYLVDATGEGRWPIIDDLVNRRINTAKESGIPGILAAKDARQRANDLMDSGKPKPAYKCMCSSYQSLVMPKSDTLACE
jgi:hypothetical protein